MQAIVTKYIPATNYRGSRIKAWCDAGSVTISYPPELSGDAVHRAAVTALCAKLDAEHAAKYGTAKRGWASHNWQCGGVPQNGAGSLACVFVACDSTAA